MSSDAKAQGREEALRLLEEGNRRHREDDIEGAIDCYRRSLELHATAEAHTFLGWMYSFQDRLDKAIEQCEIAIELDPEFGNPYNDIGTFCLRRRDTEAAITWFEQAKSATRYAPRQFPFINLGRLYLSLGQPEKALGEFEGALEHDPSNAEVRQAVQQIRSELGRSPG
jgi:Tfp pilus assembly protein PilF